MSRQVVGVALPYWLNRPSSEAITIARAADALGFDEVWMGELYHFDAFALAAHVTTVTSRAAPVIGPIAAGVRDPVSIARGVASVSELGRREVRLALGSSTPAVVTGFHDRPHGSEPERMRRVVNAVRTQLTTARAPSGYRSALSPLDPHITIAASGPRMTGVAAEVADRMVMNLVTPHQAHAAVEAVSDLPVAAWIVAALEPKSATRQQVSSQMAHYLAAPGYAETFEDAGFGELVAQARDGVPMRELAAAIPEELLTATTMYGGRTDLRTAWDSYLAAGVDPVVVPATSDDPGGRRVLELIASWI